MGVSDTESTGDVDDTDECGLLNNHLKQVALREHLPMILA